MEINESTILLKIQSNLEYTELVENITNNLTALAGCNPDQSYFIEMSLREVVSNAIQHGNKCDLNKYVQIEYRFNKDYFQVQVEDQGSGFDFDHLPDPCNPENLLKSSGRGIFLVRSFMDDFSLDFLPNHGTRVRFMKKMGVSS
jgi:serine/threonine-protein kinase RsbW